MPMSQHRPALAAILVAFVAVLSLSAVTFASADSSSPITNPIAVTALKYEGTYQGQCWVFMKKVVFEATGQEIGFDYRQGYFDAGATEVSAADAQQGDIIQIANDADTSPDASYDGLHTAIILRNNGDGTFDVVDSNRDFDGIVHERDGYDPGDRASANGLSFHIYRISGTPAPAPQAIPPASFAVGDRAVTNTPGDVLNLRPTPDFTGKLGTLPDRTLVTVLSAPIAEGGYHWVQVSTPVGNGWVASEFLLKQSVPTAAAAPASPAGSAKVGPVRTYRSFTPGLSVGD
ncbi:MAG TPA: hypothetical protein VN697_07300 [Tepidiformaceae bacterium]|nr:hypothetical protein [Tepidiformaceae bacterium]